MLQKAKDGIDKTISHLEFEFSKLQLGRANPSLVEDILVEVYGSVGPIKNSASVGILDPQTLSIKPWDKSIIHSIAKAISDSGMGLNPQSQADSIMIKIPPMTEERRKKIAIIAKKLLEEAKIGIRNARSDSHKSMKKALENKEISEDEEKDLQTDLQKLIDDANKKAEQLYKIKEADIMKI